MTDPWTPSLIYELSLEQRASLVATNREYWSYCHDPIVLIMAAGIAKVPLDMLVLAAYECANRTIKTRDPRGIYLELLEVYAPGPAHPTENELREALIRVRRWAMGAGGASSDFWEIAESEGFYRYEAVRYAVIAAARASFFYETDTALKPYDKDPYGWVLTAAALSCAFARDERTEDGGETIPATVDTIRSVIPWDMMLDGRSED